MKDEDKKKICRNWVQLITSIDAKALTPYFISAFVLSPDDDEKIRACALPRDQNDTFLKMIIKKGDSAYSTMLDALKKTGNDHIVCLLEKGKIEAGN